MSSIEENNLSKLFNVIYNNLEKKLKLSGNGTSKSSQSSKQLIIESLVLMIKLVFSLLLFNEDDKESYQFEKSKNLNFSEYLSFSFKKVEAIFPFLFNSIENNYSMNNAKVLEKLSRELFISYKNVTNTDNLGQIYEKVLEDIQKEKLGLFYTPKSIVNFILDKVEYLEDKEIEKRKIIDPSCGSGAFLFHAVTRLVSKLKKQKRTAEEIINCTINAIFGLDIDPFAVFLAKSNIALLLLPFVKKALENNENYTFPSFNIYSTNSLELQKSSENVLSYAMINRIKKFNFSFDYVVGNPPYIEAKKMDKFTKKLCKKNFPEVTKGAFDLYICFLQLGLNLLNNGGKLGFIIPNKFTIALYAKKMREKIVNNYVIRYLVDVSHASVFDKAMVYPIIIILENTSPDDSSKTAIINMTKDIKELLTKNNAILINQKFYSSLEHYFFYFLPDNLYEREIIFKVMRRKQYPLGELLKIQWAVSFHRRGLREKFVFDKADFKSKNFYPLLGGKPFGGNSEVTRYSIKWNGLWIDYDREKAKKLNNFFPQLSQFIGEKIIICQNSKRIRSALDTKDYVCKDIFFTAKMTELAKRLNLTYFQITGFLNSKVISFFYSKIFGGTHVAGNYLHFLPLYLNTLPFPIIDENIKEQLNELVKKIMQTKDKQTFNIIDAKIDSLFYEIFQLNENERIIVEKYIKDVLS